LNRAAKGFTQKDLEGSTARKWPGNFLVKESRSYSFKFSIRKTMKELPGKNSHPRKIMIRDGHTELLPLICMTAYW
jgi:hypothetical protein